MSCRAQNDQCGDGSVGSLDLMSAGAGEKSRVSHSQSAQQGMSGVSVNDIPRQRDEVLPGESFPSQPNALFYFHDKIYVIP